MIEIINNKKARARISIAKWKNKILQLTIQLHQKHGSSCISKTVGMAKNVNQEAKLVDMVSLNCFWCEVLNFVYLFGFLVLLSCEYVIW